MTQYLSQLSLARLLVSSLLLGIALGLLYDLFRIRRLAFAKLMLTEPSEPTKHLRGLLKVSDRVLLHGEDLLFGIITGISTVILYFALSRGQVRLMAVGGEGAGFFLYRLTLGRLVMASADRILRLLAWILRTVLRLLILPPLRAICRLRKKLSARITNRYRLWREKRLTKLGQRETARYRAHLMRLASAGFSAERTNKVTDGQAKRKGRAKRPPKAKGKDNKQDEYDEA